MTSSAGQQQTPLRRDLLFVFGTLGGLGFVLLTLLTVLRWGETSRNLEALGPDARSLVTIFIVYTGLVALLRFAVTDLIYVSLVTSAFISMFPLFGLTLSVWIAVASVIATRVIGMAQLGPTKVDMQDPLVQVARTFGFFGTYGIPMSMGVIAYELLGGQIPVPEASTASTLRILCAAIVLVSVNNLLMARVEVGYGYSAWKIGRIAVTDALIILVTLPYSICMAYSYAEIGLGGVLAFAFTGILANVVGRNLAVTRVGSQRLVRRVASLTNIGRAISIRGSRDDLLRTIYNETRNVIEVPHFSIALLDEVTSELSFELDVRDGEPGPKVRIPANEGLNSWVIAKRQPLLLGSHREERALGVRSIDDGLHTESWLGVPMVARERVIGVISVQSFRRNAFNRDDVALMTAIANQAAVAIENANLYRDLEGLTYALEHRVQERTNELREANLRLMAADRSKNQFLANMSHELRTPLNSIIGFAQILMQNTKNLLSPRFYRFLENIRVAGLHLLQLINDILDLSKIDAGKMQLTPQPFALAEVVESVCKNLTGAAEARAITIRSEIPDLPYLNLDEARIKQVLFNLVANAVKFSHPGGRVTIKARLLARDDVPDGVDLVSVSVIDEGVGIEAGELRRIFDEFYQTDEARRGRGGGTGLGLSLARSFVQLHRGRIEVDSTPGVGSRFTVTLPVDLSAVLAQGSAQPDTPAQPEGDRRSLEDLRRTDPIA